MSIFYCLVPSAKEGEEEEEEEEEKKEEEEEEEEARLRGDTIRITAFQRPRKTTRRRQGRVCRDEGAVG